MLAGLTAQQTRLWLSEAVLWAHAAEGAPQMSAPYLHLAAEALHRGDLEQAEREIGRAWAVLESQPPMERLWARDQSQVLMAHLLMARGQLRSAGLLMRSGQIAAQRGSWNALSEMCPRYPSVCALADSPP